MSRLITGISGVLALSLISSAAELARGGDLSPIAGSLIGGNGAPITQGLSLFSGISREGTPSVNRASKADRAAVPVGSAGSTRTVSLRLNGFSDTTFLLRIPVATANRPLAPAPAKPTVRKPMVACEPMVSILTEVAKRLEPGRCVA
jgi:hypothetical protein